MLSTILLNNAKRTATEQNLALNQFFYPQIEEQIIMTMTATIATIAPIFH